MKHLTESGPESNNNMYHHTDVSSTHTHTHTHTHSNKVGTVCKKI